jgi:GNAT superfamily N-acetyltransferase
MNAPARLDVAIRSATRADVAALSALSSQLGYPASPEDTAARLEGLLARPDDHQVWVATASEGPIAWLHAFVARYLVDDPFVEIGGLVVAEGERGRGVGALLLAHVESWARSLGLTKVGVHSNVVRADAHRFYERAGYVLEKRQGVFLRRVAQA